MDGLGTVLMGVMLNIPITLSQAFVLLAGLGLSSAIPSTPGYVGVYQFVAVTVLAPFGIEAAAALALAAAISAEPMLPFGNQLPCPMMPTCIDPPKK